VLSLFMACLLGLMFSRRRVALARARPGAE
jgi:hypothetical protein